MFVLLDEESRSFWEEEQPDTDNETPGELDSDRDPIASTVVAIGGSVVNDGCEEEPLIGLLASTDLGDDDGGISYDSDSELVGSYYSTSNPLRCSLTLVPESKSTSQQLGNV